MGERWFGYFGGRSRTLAWLSPGGTESVVVTRRHEDPAETIVANPSSSTRHVIGTAERAQSGQGVPGIPTPMPAGTMSSRKTRGTTTSTIATRRIIPTVPRGCSLPGPASIAAPSPEPHPAGSEKPYPRGQLGQQGSYGLLSGAIIFTLHVGRDQEGPCPGQASSDLSRSGDGMFSELADQRWSDRAVHQ